MTDYGLFAGIIAIVASCLFASLAGGHAAWGLLGPVGWIIAALRGIQDAIRETNAPRD